MDRIVKIPGIRVTSCHYRRHVRRISKGAYLREVSEHELRLIIKNEGIFPFILWIDPGTTEAVEAAVRQILRNEGLELTTSSILVPRMS
jgi:hypothetical protein